MELKSVKKQDTLLIYVDGYCVGEFNSAEFNEAINDMCVRAVGSTVTDTTKEAMKIFMIGSILQIGFDALEATTVKIYTIEEFESVVTAVKILLDPPVVAVV